MLTPIAICYDAQFRARLSAYTIWVHFAQCLSRDQPNTLAVQKVQIEYEVIVIQGPRSFNITVSRQVSKDHGKLSLDVILSPDEVSWPRVGAQQNLVARCTVSMKRNNTNNLARGCVLYFSFAHR